MKISIIKTFHYSLKQYNIYDCEQSQILLVVKRQDSGQSEFDVHFSINQANMIKLFYFNLLIMATKQMYIIYYIQPISTQLSL